MINKSQLIRTRKIPFAFLKLKIFKNKKDASNTIVSSNNTIIRIIDVNQFKNGRICAASPVMLNRKQKRDYHNKQYK